MHKNQPVKIYSFYEFINLTHLQQLKIKLFSFLKKEKFKGTIIIANEGVNGTISSENDNVNKLIIFLKEILKKKIKIKTHNHSAHPFLRLKIKIKKEIVKLGKINITPSKTTGTFVKPNDWDRLLENPDIIKLDTRNSYESEIGTFENSVLTNTDNFTEFPKWIKKNHNLLKNKKIAMFCTGGIRCEKASSFLIKSGFKEIYQLDGGIISYLKETENNNQKWKGECFVFDDRVSLKEDLSQGHYEQCFACRAAVSENDKRSNMYKKGVSCPKCEKITSNRKKEGFQERTRQIKIAKKKGIKHLGS